MNFKDVAKNRFTNMLGKSNISQKLVSFLIPREMLELSLASKITNSLVRHSAGLFATVASNSMWDKENIQFTTLRGNLPFLSLIGFRACQETKRSY